MTPNRKQAFTLVELLVVIAIVGILASFLLPVLGKVRMEAKKATTATMLSNLQVALADYHRDFGLYPPEKGASPMDKPSESLYYHLVGSDIDSPSKSVLTKLKLWRKYCKPYFDFKKEYLTDYDKDNYYEAVDSWGQPWIYVRGMILGKPNTASGLGNNNKPWHHDKAYDLYSVGPDGKTGPKGSWTVGAKGYEVPVTDSSSFYKQAANQVEDGDASSGALYSQDDIANF